MKKTLLSFATLLSSSVIAHAQNTSPYWSLVGNSNATSSSKLGTTNAINLRLITNNLERMRINTAGNVGIGTLDPGSKLTINSASTISPFKVQVSGVTKFYLSPSGGVSIGNYITPPVNGLHVSGNVGIGVASPSYKLHVNGKAAITNGLFVSNGISGYSTSDNSIGVAGQGESYGVKGGAFSTGVYGGADIFGTYGQTTDGWGAFGNSARGNGVEGNSEIGNGVAGYSDAGAGGYFYSGSNSAGIEASSKEGHAGLFNGSVSASKYYTTSDKNLKQNIHDFENGLSIIQQLKPQYYQFKNDTKFSSLHLPKGKHYGLMAQDVEQVLPNLVSETEHKLRNKRIVALKPGADREALGEVIKQRQTEESITIKAVNYTELIPIIIKAMQEQQATIETQNAKIEELTQLVSKLSLNPANSGSVKLTGVSLGQSTPNPTRTSTRITYSIPTHTTKAELVFNNEAGQKVKQIHLDRSGFIDVDTSNLSAGSYFYTLVVDGTSVAAKKMVVLRK